MCLLFNPLVVADFDLSDPIGAGATLTKTSSFSENLDAVSRSTLVFLCAILVTPHACAMAPHDEGVVKVGREGRGEGTRRDLSVDDSYIIVDSVGTENSEDLLVRNDDGTVERESIRNKE